MTLRTLPHEINWKSIPGWAGVVIFWGFWITFGYSLDMSIRMSDDTPIFVLVILLCGGLLVFWSVTSLAYLVLTSQDHKTAVD